MNGEPPMERLAWIIFFGGAAISYILVDIQYN